MLNSTFQMFAKNQKIPSDLIKIIASNSYYLPAIPFVAALLINIKFSYRKSDSIN